MHRTLYLVLALTACSGDASPAAVDLRGVWAADLERLDELYVVESVPKGTERDRARTRARRDMLALRVRFEAQEATLVTATATRTVPYSVHSVYGPIVTLEALHGTKTVMTDLKLHDDGNHLTWFDIAGEVEFVLRRCATVDCGNVQ